MVKGINHITLATADVNRSLGFYSGLLGFNAKVSWNGGAYLCTGELWLCLSLDAPKPSADYSHIAFDIAQADFAAIKSRLEAATVVQWKQNHSEGDSLYILDPDGHRLELHCGNLESRLEALKAKPYPGLVWL